MRYSQIYLWMDRKKEVEKTRCISRWKEREREGERERERERERESERVWKAIWKIDRKKDSPFLAHLRYIGWETLQEKRFNNFSLRINLENQKLWLTSSHGLRKMREKMERARQNKDELPVGAFCRGSLSAHQGDLLHALPVGLSQVLHPKPKPYGYLKNPRHETWISHIQIFFIKFLLLPELAVQEASLLDPPCLRPLLRVLGLIRNKTRWTNSRMIIAKQNRKYAFSAKAVANQDSRCYSELSHLLIHKEKQLHKKDSERWKP